MIEHQAELLQVLAELKAENPWQGKIREREMKLAKCFVKFRTILGLDGVTVKFDIPLHYREWTDSGRSNYNRATKVITLKGKISVITFLHEIGHALQCKLQNTTDEDWTHEWSEQLFELAFPEQWAKLHREEGSRMLLKGDSA